MYTRQVARGYGGLAGALATAGLIGWLWLARQWLPALPFVPFDITDLMIRLAPGQVATTGIELLGVWARRILRLAGVLAMLGAGALLAAWTTDLARRRANLPQRWLWAAALTGLAFAATLAVEIAIGAGRLPPLPGLLGLLASDFAWAWVIVWAAEHLSLLEPAAGGRRQFLLRFGAAALSLAAGGFLAGERLRRPRTLAELPPLPAVQQATLAPSPAPEPKAPRGSVPGGPPAATVPAPASAPAVAAASAAPTATPPVLSTPVSMPGTPLPAFVPAGGTRPNVTPIEDFYEVSIGAEAPRVEVAAWKLEVKGLVDRPLSLTFEDLLRAAQGRRLWHAAMHLQYRGGKADQHDPVQRRAPG